MTEVSALSNLRENIPRSGSAVDFVYRALKAAITNGIISPGERLVEENVARELEVSRTPVREAIHRLDMERLVRRVPRQGVIVADLTPAQIEDLYATRAVLEGLAANLATHTMLPRGHTKLKALQTQTETATLEHDFVALASINFQFHNEILYATRNEPLIAFMEQIHDSLRRYRVTTMSYPGRAEAAMHEHHALVQAIVSHQAEQAEQIARDHINSALQIRLLIHAEKEASTFTGEVNL